MKHAFKLLHEQHLHPVASMAPIPTLFSKLNSIRSDVIEIISPDLFCIDFCDKSRRGKGRWWLGSGSHNHKAEEKAEARGRNNIIYNIMVCTQFACWSKQVPWTSLSSQQAAVLHSTM